MGYLYYPSNQSAEHTTLQPITPPYGTIPNRKPFNSMMNYVEPIFTLEQQAYRVEQPLEPLWPTTAPQQPCLNKNW